MGSGESKAKVKYDQISQEEYQELKEMYSTLTTNKQLGLQQKDLQSAWATVTDKPLLLLFMCYFDSKSGSIELGTFISFFVKMVRGSTNEKAQVLFEMFCNQNDSEEVSYEQVWTYVTNLVDSFWNMIRVEAGEGWQSWESVLCPLEHSDHLAEYLCSNLPHVDNKVTESDLVMWQASCPHLIHIQNTVVRHLYGLEEKCSLLPVCMNMSSHPSFPSLLNLSIILCLNLWLPRSLRCEWRFLFSTETHGESFSKLLASITGQGPTLVLIQDEADHMFGGFAAESWKVCPQFYGNCSSFLFSIHPKLRSYDTTGYNDHYQYLDVQQQTLPNGLGMGGQFGYCGLWLDAEFGNGHCSETCSTFRNCPMLSANKTFKARHIEVWGVGALAPPEESDSGPVGRSVLDTDLESQALLELAGRQLHSDGLREPDPQE